MSKLPKTVCDIFDKYEKRTDWNHSELEKEIFSSSMGKRNRWTYQNVKAWIADCENEYHNVVSIYVNSLYDTHGNLPSELNKLGHLINQKPSK